MKSKFSYLHVYLTSVFFLAFFIISIYLFVHPEIQLETKFGTTISGSIGGMIFILFSCFLFYTSFKNIFKVKIENQTIYIKGLFKKLIISEFEIQSINLFAERNLGLATNTTFSTVILLHNGEEIVLGDVFYRNIEELKKTITEEFKSKIFFQFEGEKSVDETLFKENDFKKFAGNPFTSFNSILLLVLSIFFSCSTFWLHE